MAEEWFFSRQRGAKEIPIGGIIEEAGSSLHFKTGDWRSFRPVVNEEKCTNCMFCVIYCPEDCIKLENGKRGRIDLDYCKGCGICAQQCPVKAIEMKKEAEFIK